MNFIAEYRTALPDNKGDYLRTYVPIEAETMQLALKEVERTVNHGSADEAVLYQAMRVTKASRVVSSIEASGAKVVIGSAYNPGPGNTDQPSP